MIKPTFKIKYNWDKRVFSARRARRLMKKQDEDINKRMNSIETGWIYNEEQLPKLSKLLNPDGQLEMTRLCDFINKNSDIPDEVILGKLVDLKYLKIYYYEVKYACSVEYMYITKKPYTDYVLTPSVSDGEHPYLAKSFIVLSKEAESELQEYCRQLRIYKTLNGWK